MLQLAISEGCEGFGMLWFPLPRRPFSILALGGKTQVQSSACSPSLHLGSGGKAKTPCKGICHPEDVMWPFCIPNMSSRAHLFPFPCSLFGSMWKSKRTGAFVKEILHLISMHSIYSSFCEKMKFVSRSYIEVQEICWDCSSLGGRGKPIMELCWKPWLIGSLSNFLYLGSTPPVMLPDISLWLMRRIELSILSAPDPEGFLLFLLHLALDAVVACTTEKKGQCPLGSNPKRKTI